MIRQWRKWDLTGRNKMALRISGVEARNRVLTYKNLVEEVEKQAQKNFDDMDFENSNRRVEMEEIINAMKTDCANIITQMENVNFED